MVWEEKQGSSYWFCHQNEFTVRVWEKAKQELWATNYLQNIARTKTLDAFGDQVEVLVSVGEIENLELESHEDWKLEVITFDLRLVRLNKTSKADTTRYYCRANRTITWLIMATELSGVQFGPKSSEWFQNQVSECAARVRFQITSMISDQNWTPLSSIATFLNEIAKFSYVITNYITVSG